MFPYPFTHLDGLMYLYFIKISLLRLRKHIYVKSTVFFNLQFYPPGDSFL